MPAQGELSVEEVRVVGSPHPNPTEDFTGVAVAAAAADALLGDVAVTVAVVGGGGGGGGGAARTAVWTATKADWQTEYVASMFVLVLQ